jgi:hypothetical protein
MRILGREKQHALQESDTMKTKNIIASKFLPKTVSQVGNNTYLYPFDTKMIDINLSFDEYFAEKQNKHIAFVNTSMCDKCNSVFHGTMDFCLECEYGMCSQRIEDEISNKMSSKQKKAPRSSKKIEKRKFFMSLRSPRLYGVIKKMEKLLAFNKRDPYQIQSTDISIDEYEIQSTTKVLDDHEWIINLIESVVLSYNHFKLCKSNSDYVDALISLLKKISSRSLTNTIVQSSFFQERLNDFNLQIQSESTTEDIYENVKSKFQNFKDLKESRVWQKFYKLLMFVLSFALFEKFGITYDKLGYSTMEKEMMRKKYCSRSEFAECIADSIFFIIDAGMQIMKTGKVGPIYHSSKTYVQWFELSEELRRKSKLLSNPEAHGFTECEYRAQLDDVIDKGYAMLKVTHDMDGYEKKILRSLHNELLMLKYELTTKQAARETRKPPCAILIYGDSGIGKSFIKDLLYYHFCRVEGLPSDDYYRYTKNPTAKYWDGWSTSMHTVILDDVAFMHPNKASQGDPSVMEFLQIINPVPFVPDQADLADKGRTPMRAKLCIATTNTENLNAHYYFSCASAVQRRFPFILCPKVKKEFIGDDGMLDSSKVIVNEGEYPDIWHWTIKLVQPTPVESNQRLATMKIVLQTDSVYEMLQWYTQTIQNFNKNQDIMMKSVNTLKTMEVCSCCFLPSNKCACVTQYGYTFYLGFLCAWFYNFIAYLFVQDIFMYLFKMTGSVGFLYLHSYTSTYVTCKNTMRWFKYRSERIANLGDKVSALFTPPRLIAVGAVLSTIYTIYKFSRKDEVQSTDEGSKPVPDEVVKENVWYKKEMDLVSFDVSEASLSSNGLKREEFINVVKKNICSFYVKTTPGNIREGRMFCLQGNIYITNNHIFPIQELFDIKMVFQSSRDGVNQNFTFRLSESDLKRYPDKDIVVIRINYIPPRKGLRRFCQDRVTCDKNNGFYLSRNLSGQLEVLPVNTIRFSNEMAGKIVNDPMLSGIPSRITRNGECGSVLIVETNMGFIVAGIHTIGNLLKPKSFAIAFNLADIEYDNFSDIIISSEPMLSSQSVDRPHGDLHHKSVFRYIDSGTADIYGSFVGFRGTHKSNVEVTKMAYKLAPLGYNIKYGKPVMNTYEPWRIAALDMVKPVSKINTAIVDEIKQSFIRDILDNLKSSEFKKIQVYDNFTTINGAEGVLYVDKINRNTSAGNPWKKSKKFFMESIPAQHGMQQPVKIDDEIMDRVDIIIDKYKKGERAHPNFCAHLKDEAVSFKKIKQGKTRVFTGAPLDWTIVVRKYLLSSVRVIQGNRYIFESAPGIVAQSAEWSELYQYLTHHGEDNIVAGDYKAFDKRMSPIFILAAFDILHEICKHSGNYSENDLKIIRGIGYDTAFSLVDYNGDLVQFYGTNPSGHPLTVIINGLVNSLYMRYAYHELNPRRESHTFKNNVNLMTYGDDNIMGVSPKTKWFNHTDIAKIFSDIDITYTMADKEAESIPFINIKDASFLKRSWQWNEDLQNYLAPLEHDSIEKMLMVWVKSKTISEEEQIIAVISSAVREYFFYGQIIFESKVRLLKWLCKELDIEDWIHESTFPTWKELCNQYNGETINYFKIQCNIETGEWNYIDFYE